MPTNSLMKKLFVHLLSYSLVILALTSCYEEFDFTPEIVDKDKGVLIGGSKLFLDSENQIALLPVNEYGDYEGVLKFPVNNQMIINEESIVNNQKFEFGDITGESSYSLELIKENGIIENYNLQFTLLPVLEIRHKYPEILDDPKIIASFYLLDPSSNKYYEEYCGIETRGGSANHYSKKSYSIEFNKISSLDVEKNVSLFEMDPDDDWILDASYIDQSNIRNRVSFEIWKDLQSESEEHDSIKMPSSTEGKYVELFINEEYRGLYCISEIIDEKRLNLNDSEEQAFLYKSEQWSPATTYLGLPDTLGITTKWSEWEQKYPDPDELSIWKPLYEFVEFIYVSPDDEFSERIRDFLDMDQSMDYFILMNLILGHDNAGKNLFLAKTSTEEPFFISPWDMDASWGRNWEGISTTINGLVSFRIFNRLLSQNPDNYRENLKDRWFDLRSDVLSQDNILEKFDQHYQEISLSGAAGREFEKWPESLPDFESELAYIDTWISGRLNVLDIYFNNL